MRKLILIFSILLIFSQLDFGTTTFSSGVNTKSCNSSVCNSTKNCRCASTTNPGNFSLNDLPQFVLFTWDDAIRNDVWTTFLPPNQLFYNDSIKDSLGCRIRPTFYVSTFQTDYNYVNEFSKIGLVCDHSVNHNATWASNASTYQYETKTSKDWIQGYSKISYTINCSRAPFLFYGDNYFASLLNSSIYQDSSVLAPVVDNTFARYWPYTLDYGLQSTGICTTNVSNSSQTTCPTKAYNLWEIPLQVMYEKDSTGTITTYWSDSMDPNVTSANYDQAVARFKYNFDDNYHKSRVPIGLYIHYQWFLVNSSNWDFSSMANFDTIKLQFTNAYYNFISTYDKVVFATEEMIFQWVKNPITYSQIQQQRLTNLSSIYQCPFYYVNQYNTCPTGYNLTLCQNVTGGVSFYACGNCSTLVNYTCPALSNNCILQNQNCQCLSCATGYTLQNGTCVSSCPSVANCQVQDSSTCQCTTCNSGYQVNSGVCQACTTVSQCTSYSSSCSCNTCQTGYQLSNGICQNCGVAQCTAYSSGCTCNSCSTGYQVSSGSCVSCTVSQCLSYSSGCTCSSCSVGYQVSNGICTTCGLITGCASYATNCTCNSCISGYTLSSGTCNSICSSVSNCYTLNSSTCLCTTCDPGYTLSSGACQNYTNLFSLDNIGFCLPNSTEGTQSDWLYDSCSACYQLSIDQDCTVSHNSPSSSLYAAVNCDNWVDFCAKKGWCKSTNSNILKNSCTTSCQSCTISYDGTDSCASSNMVCATDAYCENNVKLCSVYHS